MNIKSEMIAILHGSPVQVRKWQKDFGIFVNNCLIWTNNGKKGYSEGMNELHLLKQNLSEKAHWTTNLNACTGNLVPIVTYAYEGGIPNRANTKKLEKIRKKH